MPTAGPPRPLTDAERARHARTLGVRGIGEEGLARLRAARVAVVGAGGLGSPVLAYLVAAGVGHVTIIDDDEVAAHNLQRQVLHDEASVGTPKAASAARRLAALDASVGLAVRRVRLTAANADDLLAGHDLVVDCTDNVATRLAVAEASGRLGVPEVWGAISGAVGQVTVFRPGGPGLRDLWPEALDAVDAPGAPVFGPAVGVVGSLMASEAVKLVTGAGTPLVGRVLHVDALAATVTTFDLIGGRA